MTKKFDMLVAVDYIKSNERCEFKTDKVILNYVQYLFINLSCLEFWYELSTERKIVLADMACSLGFDNFMKFEGIIMAIKEKDYPKASNEIIDSSYADKIGERAYVNSSIMRTGVFVNEVKKDSLRQVVF